jgi:hypothetical protein
MKRVTIDSTNDTTSADPTLALQRNNRPPAGTSGLLNLRNAQQEVFLLLDRLEVIQDTLIFNDKESMYQSGRACALAGVQEELLRRSKLSHVGTAEGRILRREAANLDGMRDKAYKAYKEAPRALGMRKDLESSALVNGKLRLSINRLFEEARAAQQTAERLAGQAAPGVTPPGTAPEAAMQTAQYPVWKDHLLVSLATERRVLKRQKEELVKENRKQRGDISRLQRQVDDLRARQAAAIMPLRDVPRSLVPGRAVPLLNLQPIQGEPTGIQRASAPWNFT